MPAISAVDTAVLEDPHNPQLLVRVRADDGVSGVGETWWGIHRPQLPAGAPVRPIRSMIDDLLAPACLGLDAEDTAGVWDALWREVDQYGEGVTLAALSGIDLALWDGRGRRSGRPVVELLGGAVHPSRPVYASLSWLGEERAVRRDVRRAVAAGFRGVKVHEHDPALVAAARDEAGPDLALMVDVNGRFDEEGAVAAARAYGPSRLTWLEEPTRPFRDHDLLARVKAAAGVPIAAGEEELTLDGFRHLLYAGVDVLQPELVKLGGITPSIEIGRLAAERGVPVCPHSYSLGPSFLANVHWGLATVATTWLELPFLPPGQEFPSGMPVPGLVDGEVTVPDRPGLGRDWDGIW